MVRGRRTVTSEMEIEGTKVTLKKKAGLKNLYMRVSPGSGEITVSAPMHVRLAEIRLFASENIAKILAVREKLLQAGREEKCGYVTGETHYLWGKPYTLQTVHDGEKYGLRREGEKLILTVPEGTRREIRAALFRDFYFREMREALKGLLPECEKRTGLHADEVHVKNMKSCWGSCSMVKKRISVNLQLAKTPPACLKYIVFHEMIHLREKKHGSAFYGCLDEYYPPWREADRMLLKLSLGSMAENML